MAHAEDHEDLVAAFGFAADGPESNANVRLRESEFAGMV